MYDFGPITQDFLNNINPQILKNFWNSPPPQYSNDSQRKANFFRN
jgi:hypothetical protein